MALGFTTQGAVAVCRIDFPRNVPNFSSASANSSGRGFSEGTAVCLHGPVLKSRVNNARPPESLSSPLNALHQAAVSQHHGSSTTLRNGIFVNEVRPGTVSSALIDIEDSGDGSVTFKYGAVEDLWDLDRLLEYLCGGAFSCHTAESFVRVVVELFRVPVSYKGQRKMVELLSSYVRLRHDVNSEELEKTVSQVLAEAASEFLPPSDVGSYSKGSARPYKRFSSRVDKWWKKLDNYFGVGDGSIDFLSEQTFAGLDDGYPIYPSGNYEKLKHCSNYESFQRSFSQSLHPDIARYTWKDPPSHMSWLARPPDRRRLEASETSTLEFVRDVGLSEQRESDYIPGLGFQSLLSSQVNTLENVLRRTDLEESVRDPDCQFTRRVNDLETLPCGSIQAMMEWEREEVFVPSSVRLPSSNRQRVSMKVKKASQQTKSKSTQRVRTKTTSTKSASKKKSSAERRTESQLCDMFFGLPLSHKCSGVASFLAMRKNFAGEMLVVLNQVAVGFAGAGVAFTLHVVARMLSLNSTFDSIKLFGLIRGASLLWLSAAMQSLRKVMLRLPAGSTVCDFKDKSQLLCLQQRLRNLAFTAMTVMVLQVVGHGF